MFNNKGKVSQEAVMAALSKVQEPELHRDLVSLNMIRDLKIEGGKVSFTVMLTTPACPLRTRIAREAREGLLDADIYGPNVPLMMGVNGRPAMADNKLIPLEAYGVKVMSIGLLL